MEKMGMSKEERRRRLSVPCEKIRLVMDTDAKNEIDDQFAIAWALKSTERFDVEAVYAAPFSHDCMKAIFTGKKIEHAAGFTYAEDPGTGMEQSYEEICKLYGLLGLSHEKRVFRGSRQYISDQGGAVESEAAKYVTGEDIEEERKVKTVQEAIQGAKDIIAEAISDNADHRCYIREATVEEGVIVSTAKDEKAASVYEMYYDFEEPVRKVAGHRILALNRGEAEKILTVKVNAPQERILRYLAKQTITRENPYTKPLLTEAIEDSYGRLIAPAIEREIRSDLTEKAEDGAITVFGKNLEQLLLQPPIAGKVVLGWDPAFRTGCKLAVVDSTGKVLDTKVIYPTAPQNKVEESKRELKRLIAKYHVDLISVGNGTASRESEQIIVDLLKELDRPVQYVIVNEAGASVYSASKLATEEFPNFDVGQRSAASIARRLQDPLAELVKIDPKSIGVGQYQHDMNQKKLSDALSGVVEASVNKVGVDLNTASAPLMEYVSGINKTIARNIVDYREANGRFTDRRQLLKVAKLGPKAFEQCAGFMRILDGDNPLDATSVHPESYEATKKLLDRLGLTMEDVRQMQKKAAEHKNAAPAGGDRAAAGQGAPAGEGKAAGRAGQTGGAGAGQKKQNKKGDIRISNTNTAMGRALAAAMGGMGISGNGASDGGSGKGAASGSDRAAGAGSLSPSPPPSNGSAQAAGRRVHPP